jgi:lysophospholipase L1-like esterase
MPGTPRLLPALASSHKSAGPHRARACRGAAYHLKSGFRLPRARFRAAPVLTALILLAGLLLPAAARASAGISYVALGDSYTSGPLIPDQTGSPPGCLRSSHDYPALVAAALHPAAFADVSCQGATTANMTAPEPVVIGTNPPQLGAMTPATTLVSLQIGGNDIGFASIVLTCAGLSYTDPFGAPCKDHYTAGGTDQLAQAIAATAPKVAAALQAIHQRAPGARVLVVGYPDILPNSGNGCWPAEPIAFGDVPYLRGVEAGLNAMLAQQAQAGGATFVDTYTDSIGHDFCQPTGVRWVEGVVPTSPAAPVHPNELGEQAMARQVLATIG